MLALTSSAALPKQSRAKKITLPSDGSCFPPPVATTKTLKLAEEMSGTTLVRSSLTAGFTKKRNGG